MGGSAWVTLATNDSYSLGALVLAHSLKQAGTVHQLAVLITPGVTRAMREKLETVFDVVKEVNVLDSRDEANLRLLKRPELGVTFTKLHCWTLTQFDKCVFLDADTLVLQNSDELFERDEFSAAPDVGWPDCFNSGVFVYRPSMQTYESLIQFALERGSFDGGDQGLLNLYFSDWAHKDISKHLPFIYNMCSTACYSYLPAFKQFGSNAKIMHFIGSQKPWLQYFNTETRRVQPSGDSAHLEGVLQRWWDIFCSLIHPHLSPAMAGLAGAFSQLTLGVARTVEQDALENLLRKQAWEVGNIDYLGKDSFDNIWSKITETLSSGPAQAAVPAPEEAPSAPAESQSQTVPQQEAQSPAIENIESSLIDAEVKAPEADKPAQTCSIATKPDIVQEPIACPSVPPEQPAAPKTESPAEVKPETPQPAAVEETLEQPPQEAVAPTPLTEQPPAPLITPLQPKEETAQETVVSKEQPQQVPTEIIKAVPVTPETPKAEQSPVPAEQPNKEQLAPPEDPILATPPIAAPPQSCELKPVEAVKGDKPASEAPAQPAQPEVQVAKPVEVASAPAPAELILPEVKAVRQEKPAEIVTEPVAPKVEAVKQDKSAEVVSAQAPAELIAPKVEPVKQEKPVSQAKPSEVEAAKQGKPVEVVSTPQAPVEAVAPVVEVGKQEKAAASGAQAQGVAAPSKESKDAPTPPPRKTDKPKKGASKSKK